MSITNSQILHFAQQIVYSPASTLLPVGDLDDQKRQYEITKTYFEAQLKLIEQADPYLSLGSTDRREDYYPSMIAYCNAQMQIHEIGKTIEPQKGPIGVHQPPVLEAPSPMAIRWPRKKAKEIPFHVWQLIYSPGVFVYYKSKGIGCISDFDQENERFKISYKNEMISAAKEEFLFWPTIGKTYLFVERIKYSWATVVAMKYERNALEIAAYCEKKKELCVKKITDLSKVLPVEKNQPLPEAIYEDSSSKPGHLIYQIDRDFIPKPPHPVKRM